MSSRTRSLLAAMVVLWIIASFTTSGADSEDPGIVGQVRQLKRGFPGCLSTDSLSRAAELATDEVALRAFIANPATGCIVMPEDLVTVEADRGTRVKVRAKGDPTSYWTIKSALK